MFVQQELLEAPIEHDGFDLNNPHYPNSQPEWSALANLVAHNRHLWPTKAAWDKAAGYLKALPHDWDRLRFMEDVGNNGHVKRSLREMIEAVELTYRKMQRRGGYSANELDRGVDEAESMACEMAVRETIESYGLTVTEYHAIINLPENALLQGEAEGWAEEQLRGLELNRFIQYHRGVSFQWARIFLDDRFYHYGKFWQKRSQAERYDENYPDGSGDRLDGHLYYVTRTPAGSLLMWNEDQPDAIGYVVFPRNGYLRDLTEGEIEVGK